MTVGAVSNDLPGPRAMPLLGVQGNFLSFLRDPVGLMRGLYRDYGEIVSLARGTDKYVFVFGPAYNQFLLGDVDLFHNLDAGSSPLRLPRASALSRLFAGLTQMNGERHKRHRRLMMPVLHKRRIQGCCEEIAAVTERKLADWRVGQLRDIYAEMRGLTLGIAARTLVGLDPDRNGKIFCRLFEAWTDGVFSIPTVLLPFDLPGLPYRRLLALSERLEVEIRALIQHKRECASGQGDVLSLLMQAQDQNGAPLTDDELLGETSLLFVAGHATMASVLTWALFLLSQHPRILDGVREECAAKLRGGVPSMELLADLPRLEAVIKETMRLLPPVIWWSRISTAPFDLGPYRLPRGTKVSYSAYITHRLPKYYPEPDRFVPERWQSADPGPYEYLPFSAGPRMCLGSNLAMIELKVVLAHVLQRFHLAVPPRARIDYAGMMLSEPGRGMPMILGSHDQAPTRSELRGNIRSLVDMD